MNNQINNIEATYPGYDEYQYAIDEIGHDPYELAALLTVLYEDYRESEVQEMLQTIYSNQYTLTIESETETRTGTETRIGTRTVRNADGTTSTVPYTHEVDVEYDYKILKVTLSNHGISAVAGLLDLTEDQMQRYLILLHTQGN